LSPDVGEWLPSDHLAWFVFDAVADRGKRESSSPGAGLLSVVPNRCAPLAAHYVCLGSRAAAAPGRELPRGPLPVLSGAGRGGYGRGVDSWVGRAPRGESLLVGAEGADGCDVHAVNESVALFDVECVAIAETLLVAGFSR
jgi:hypothetical protein